ncbi:hypothetical protein GCM10023149_17690 [Mucilaginibacter gynuensis]|uniref:Secreted protein n=1 Tax=Mucilaginibacter gynuensis TaxID=1302236 RepID=A0ABP8G7R8_9SPHI
MNTLLVPILIISVLEEGAVAGAVPLTRQLLAVDQALLVVPAQSYVICATAVEQKNNSTTHNRKKSINFFII